MDEQLRRRSVGAPAARSLLLTVLGEYVLPRPGGVWQETLVAALASLGYSQQAARQALSRSTREGWLESRRRGRRTRMTLTEPTAELLRSGAARIYSFGDPWEWDGRWLLVVLRVPEERREVRHQLRSRLAWAGLGSLGGGVWLTPHVEREGELAAAINDEPAAGASSFRAQSGSIGDPRQLVASGLEPRAGLRAVPGVHRGLRPRARDHAAGMLSPADAARARVAEVPVPGSRPARRAAAGPAGRASAPMRCSTTATSAGGPGPGRISTSSRRRSRSTAARPRSHSATITSRRRGP